ncbi:MAG: UPF0234 protein Yitk, partial [uncultured Lysobacter sp.]
ALIRHRVRSGHPRTHQRRRPGQPRADHALRLQGRGGDVRTGRQDDHPVRAQRIPAQADERHPARAPRRPWHRLALPGLRRCREQPRRCAPEDHRAAGHRTRPREEDPVRDEGRQAQGRQPDQRRQAARERQEARRPAGGDGAAARAGVRAPAAVRQLPRL